MRERARVLSSSCGYLLLGFGLGQLGDVLPRSPLGAVDEVESARRLGVVGSHGGLLEQSVELELLLIAATTTTRRRWSGQQDRERPRGQAKRCKRLPGFDLGRLDAGCRSLGDKLHRSVELLVDVVAHFAN